jgi:putative endonuclease
MTNKSRTLYTGVTNNLERRVYEHKQKLNPGFTTKYNISRLFISKRSRKIALIESVNPEWEDLSFRFA